MSFLNIVMLAGLATAAIPFLIHLFQRQQVSTVDFSSILFIKRLPVSQASAVKLRHIVLLVLRTLIIALAAFAFARPVLSGFVGAWLGSSASQKTAVAIVLDNSYSMGAGGVSTPFSAAQEAALALMDDLGDGDYAVVVFTATPAHAEPEHPTQSLTDVSSLLKKATPSYGTGDMAAALGLAGSLLAEIDAVQKTVYLMTDLRRNDWHAFTDSTIREIVKPPITLSIVPFPTQNLSNISLDDIRVGEFVSVGGGTVDITANYTNRSDAPVSGRRIHLYLNGVKRGIQSFSAQPGQSGSVKFSLAPEGSGWFEGYVETETDDLMADNRGYFSFQVPERIWVDIIAGDDAAYFVQQVLRPGEMATTAIDVRRASVAELNGDVREQTEVLLVDTGAGLSAVHAETLKRFVERGGGLLMFLGDGDLKKIETLWLRPVFDVAVQGMSGAPGQRQAHVRLSDMDAGHPVFAGLEGAWKKNEDAPKFYAHHRLVEGSGATALAHYSDGAPAILEGRLGRGRVLLLTAGTDTRWTDLALKGFFVPFMHRAVRYLHPANLADRAYGKIGRPIETALPGLPSDGIVLRSPSGEETAVAVQTTHLGMTATIANPRNPGVYRLLTGTRTIKDIAVNVDTQESDIANLTPEEVVRLVPEARIGNTGSVLTAASKTPESDEYEIWKTLIWLVVMLLIVEAWYAGMPRKTT
ncbi:MAG: BatA domain-containing protein [candidate division Zixibacteria bacterium]|nr:BatA domain-containing protein [candidate division Zixibacteria bacterium]